MIGLPCFGGAFCTDQDNTDGAASDLETNVDWSSVEESDDSEPTAAGGTPSRQKQPPRVSLYSKRMRTAMGTRKCRCFGTCMYSWLWPSWRLFAGGDPWATAFSSLHLG